MAKFKQLLIIVLSAFALLIVSTLFLFKEETNLWQPAYQLADNLDEKSLKENEKIVRINNRELIVEIADDPQEQSLGLSFRQILPQNKGMLFVFPNPATTSFWMREMNFPLDIIWIDDINIIVGIEKNISPSTFPQTFSPPFPIKYVLEVNAGWTDLNKIKVDDIVSF